MGFPEDQGGVGRAGGDGGRGVKEKEKCNKIMYCITCRIRTRLAWVGRGPGRGCVKGRAKKVPQNNVL